MMRPGFRWRRFLRWWRLAVVGRLDHPAIIRRIDHDAGWSLRYLFMVLMSAGIAILGLLQSSPAVIIGAMLISPLMGPIIGLGFALAVFDWREVRRALLSLAMGSLVAVSITALIVLASPLQSVTSEILARTRPNLFDLLVAILSALAGTYATIRGRGETVVGVAIATALMPPLAVVGYGLATFNGAIFGGALALFFTNFIAIALSAALMARAYGFAQELSPEQSRTQTLLITGVFVVMAAPLAFSLRQIAGEALATRALRAAVVAEFGPGTRISQLETNYDATPDSASVVVVTRAFQPGADKRVENAWAARLGREVRVSLSQLVADQDLPRLEQERNALAEAQRQDAAVTGLADAALLVTGAPRENLVLDQTRRQLVVRALPGTGLSTLALAEARLAARHPDWRIRFIPAVTTRLEVMFEPGSAELSPGGRMALADTLWALQRWDLKAVRLTGLVATQNDGAPARWATLATARAETIKAALAEAGIRAEVTTDLPGPRQRAAERESGPGAFRKVLIEPA